MSISQTLLTSQHGYDIFAPSWQAGLSSSQCLKKSSRKYDVEGVNIVETCEQLCLALNQNSNSNNEMTPGTDDEKQCAVQKSSIPFRTFSNIWFGTLKIYQQQVNTLLRQSKDLFSRSCNYNVKHMEANKRKSSVTSTKTVKKRRLTLCNSNQKSYNTTNYSDLLDDLEKLIQEPKESLTELSASFAGKITQIQIREITIREVNATTYTSPDIIDEDSGFGEATHEEIAQFFSFIGDNSIFNSKRTPTKRKLTSVQETPIKRGCYNDVCPSEALCKENTPPAENILKRSITSPFDETKVMKTANILQQNYIVNDFTETVEIKKEKLTDVENKDFPKVLGPKEKNKLIIDECTKIDLSEIFQDMKISKLLAKLPRTIIIKSYKSKRNIAASELLTSFNRRSLKQSFSIKRKCYISREQFERDYLNLLREIFYIYYNELWASEIYPKWKCFEDVLRKRNKKQSVKKLRKRKTFALQADGILNLSGVLTTNGIDDNYLNEYHQIPNLSNYSNIITLNTRDEWRTYGVMKKLLNLWRFNHTNKIRVSTLFKLAENQIDRALCFNSLLYLSKAQFVYLTSFPKSIELENILMGKAVEINLANKST